MPITPARLGAQFDRLWTACAAASAADGLRYAALPLAAAAVTRDPRMVALVSAASFAPSVLSILVGVAVDRAGARRILQWAAGIQAVAFVALAFAMLGGAAPVLVLCVASFLFGSGEVATDIAVESLPGQLVEPEDAAVAFGRISATELTVEDVAGPAAGGLLFAVSPAAPFLAAGLAAGLAVLAAGRIRQPGREADERIDFEAPKKALHEIQEGFRWLRDRPRLMVMYAAMAVAAMAGTAGEAVLVLLMLDEVGVTPAVFGVVLAVAAVGAVLGASVSPWFVRRLGSPSAVASALAAAAVLWFLLGVSRAPFLAVAALTVGTAAIAAGRVAATTFRQAEASDTMRGRAASLYRTSMLVAQFLGALAGGAVAGAWGVRGPFLAGAPVVFLAAVGLFVAARRAGAPAEEQAAESTV